MAHDPTTEALFARLNALKPSSIRTLNADALAPTPAHQSGSNASVDELTARFASLNGDASLRQKNPGSTLSTEEAAEDALLNADGTDDLSLEELLEGLNGDGEDWRIDETDIDSSKGLAEEAQAALRDAKREGLGPVEAQDHELRPHHNDEAESSIDRGSGEEHETSEDQEMDEYIRLALAEAALEEPDDNKPSNITTDQAENEEQEHPNNDDDLDFPSAPIALPSTPSEPAILPSVPTFQPVFKPPVVTTNKGISKHTDEEIETWCCICNDDATVKCLGCGGELYCGNCWNEGHRGEDAGMEEKLHRAVRFVKPGRDKKTKNPRRAIGVGG